jgi:hypothetical protein
MMKRFGLLTVSVLSFSTAVNAQSNDAGLARLVPNLILQGITLPGADDPGRPHAGHFTLGNPTFGGSQPPSRVDESAKLAVAAFGDRLRAQFANVPLGSSTGGFTYTFDEASGAYTRSSPSFGPAFTERATTIGRRRLSLGVNYQHSSFDTFGGQNLKDGSIKFYLPHTDCCNAVTPPPSPQVPFFEGDVIEAALTLKATTDTVALFANYGVTDRFDVGVAVPITRVDVDASARATILRLSTAATPLVHSFVEGQNVSEKTFSSAGTATGIGDIVLRTKYNFLPVGAGLASAGVAVAFDLRLPTGNEDDLLGMGTPQGKFSLILSSRNDRVSPHINVGYLVSGMGNTDPLYGFDPVGVSDEFSYAGGLEIVAHPKLTILADVLGRTLKDAGDLNLEAKSFRFLPTPTATSIATSTTNPLTGLPYQELAFQRGRNLTLTLGSTGLKYNPSGNLLIAANVLFPLSNAGLRDKLTFALGVDYAF